MVGSVDSVAGAQTEVAQANRWMGQQARQGRHEAGFLFWGAGFPFRTATTRYFCLLIAVKHGHRHFCTQ